MIINDPYGLALNSCSKDGLTEMIKETANRMLRETGGWGEYADQNISSGAQHIKPVMQTEPAAVRPKAASLYYFMPSFPTTRHNGQTFLDAQALQSDFPILRQSINGHPLVWLDNAATTQKPQCVIDALDCYYSGYNSNIHRGAHSLARRATESYEAARAKLQRFIGAASKDEIVFVRGTTEAVNLVAGSWGQQNLKAGDEIILTEMEHHSNIVPWQITAQNTGAYIKKVPVDEAGALDIDQYERLFSPKTRIVSTAYVSNVLGTVNPVRQMADIAHRHGALIFVDAAQAVAHLHSDVLALGADFFAFSGHKMYGPTGIGVLYARKELLCRMPPYQTGGGMIKSVRFDQTLFSQPPQKFEAGTANIADAVGLGAAVDYMQNIGMLNIMRHEARLTQRLFGQLKNIAGMRLIGTVPGKTGVVSFVIDSIPSETIAKHLDRLGFAVRAGHHCAQPLIHRFGLNSTLRASLGVYNTAEEIDRFVIAVEQLAEKQRPLF